VTSIPSRDENLPDEMLPHAEAAEKLSTLRIRATDPRSPRPRSIWHRRYALPRPRRRRSPLLTAAAASIVAASVVFLALRSMGRRDALGITETTAPIAPSNSSVDTAPVGNQDAETATETNAPTQAKPQPKPASPAPVAEVRSTPAAASAVKADESTQSSKPPPAPAPPQTRLALDVGNYISEERAKEERDRLVLETGLEGWVIPDGSEGLTMYRVVVGPYSSAERAENSADILLSRDLVYQARVIPLPPRHLRRSN
jgi:hypothetical protein